MVQSLLSTCIYILLFVYIQLIYYTNAEYDVYTDLSTGITPITKSSSKDAPIETINLIYQMQFQSQKLYSYPFSVKVILPGSTTPTPKNTTITSQSSLLMALHADISTTTYQDALYNISPSLHILPLDSNSTHTYTPPLRFAAGLNEVARNKTWYETSTISSSQRYLYISIPLTTFNFIPKATFPFQYIVEVVFEIPEEDRRETVTLATFSSSSEQNDDNTTFDELASFQPIFNQNGRKLITQHDLLPSRSKLIQLRGEINGNDLHKNGLHHSVQQHQQQYHQQQQLFEEDNERDQQQQQQQHPQQQLQSNDNSPTLTIFDDGPISNWSTQSLNVLNIRNQNETEQVELHIEITTASDVITKWSLYNEINIAFSYITPLLINDNKIPMCYAVDYVYKCIEQDYYDKISKTTKKRKVCGMYGVYDPKLVFGLRGYNPFYLSLLIQGSKDNIQPTIPAQKGIVCEGLGLKLLTPRIMDWRYDSNGELNYDTNNIPHHYTTQDEVQSTPTSMINTQQNNNKDDIIQNGFHLTWDYLHLHHHNLFTPHRMVQILSHGERTSDPKRLLISHYDEIQIVKKTDDGDEKDDEKDGDKKDQDDKKTKKKPHIPLIALIIGCIILIPVCGHVLYKLISRKKDNKNSKNNYDDNNDNDNDGLLNISLTTTAYHDDHDVYGPKPHLDNDFTTNLNDYSTKTTQSTKSTNSTSTTKSAWYNPSTWFSSSNSTAQHGDYIALDTNDDDTNYNNINLNTNNNNNNNNSINTNTTTQSQHESTAPLQSELINPSITTTTTTTTTTTSKSIDSINDKNGKVAEKRNNNKQNKALNTNIKLAKVPNNRKNNNNNNNNKNNNNVNKNNNKNKNVQNNNDTNDNIILSTPQQDKSIDKPIEALPPQYNHNDHNDSTTTSSQQQISSITDQNIYSKYDYNNNTYNATGINDGNENNNNEMNNNFNPYDNILG